jgi:hypothetical protein
MSGASVDPTNPLFPTQIPFSLPAKMTSPLRTFSERFCERYRLPPESYAPEMLRRVLYPRARWLAPVIRLFSPGIFDADCDFVRGVGQIRRAEDLDGEVSDFHLHPRNRGFLRRILKIRVSCRRVSHLVAAIMPPGNSSPAGNSGAPPAPNSLAGERG